MVLLALLGVALILAAFRVDVPMVSGGSPTTWHGWVHGIAFLLIIAMGILAPLTMALAVRDNPAWRPNRGRFRGAGALFVVFLLLQPPGSGDSSPDPVHGRRLAQEAAARIARPVVAGSGGIEVLLGYSIMLEAWDLENELATTGYVGDPADLKSYQLLSALAEGGGGHLAPLFATL